MEMPRDVTIQLEEKAHSMSRYSGDCMYIFGKQLAKSTWGFVKIERLNMELLSSRDL